MREPVSSIIAFDYPMLIVFTSRLYMAPEILRYEKYDAKADLWSVGAVVYEAAVGRPPFRAQNHIELLKKIDHARSRVHFPDEVGLVTPFSALGSNMGSRTPRMPTLLPAEISFPSVWLSSRSLGVY